MNEQTTKIAQVVGIWLGFTVLSGVVQFTQATIAVSKTARKIEKLRKQARG